MPAFDTTVNVGDASIQAIEDDQGKIKEAHLIFGSVTLVPINERQLLPVPVGVYRFPFHKQAIGELIKQLESVHEKMSEHTEILTATDLGAVEQAAQFQASLRK